MRGYYDWQKKKDSLILSRRYVNGIGRGGRSQTQRPAWVNWKISTQVGNLKPTTRWTDLCPQLGPFEKGIWGIKFKTLGFLKIIDIIY